MFFFFATKTISLKNGENQTFKNNCKYNFLFFLLKQY